MARSSREEDDTQDLEEADAPKLGGGRGPQPPRISITLPQSARRKIRLAAALADMSEPEWARVVLAQAAKRTVEKAGF